MADKTDVVLEEDTVRVRGAGGSPVLDVEGENHWNLAESDGDVRIGDEENRLKMGVALGGAGAGNARVWATSHLFLGSAGESVVRIGDEGVYPHGGDYSLGAHGDRWSSVWVDGDVSLVGGELTVEGRDALVKTDGDLVCTGQAAVTELVVGEVIGGLTPQQSGGDLGSSRNRWGTVYADAVNTPSDRRLKTDVEDVEGGLDAVLDLRPVSYSWRGDGDGTSFGLIGQEVWEVLPEVVDVPEDDDGFLGVDYRELVAVLVDAVQTQHEETDALAERVDRQRERIEAHTEQLADQRERIEALEERLSALEGA